MPGVAGFIVSTIAFFVASHFIRRQLVEMGIPQGLSRGLSVFALALAVSYGVGYVVDMLMP